MHSGAREGKPSFLSRGQFKLPRTATGATIERHLLSIQNPIPIRATHTVNINEDRRHHEEQRAHVRAQLQGAKLLGFRCTE
eukprot:1596886-Rhodomonas_salina.1